MNAKSIQKYLEELLGKKVNNPKGYTQTTGTITGYTIRFSRKTKEVKIMCQVTYPYKGTIVTPSEPLEDLEIL